MRRGSHVLAFWSSTQTLVALSSAEAELNGLAKCIGQSLHLKSALHEMRQPTRLLVHTDASAARGILLRKGPGKLKHLQIRQFGFQQAVASGDLDLIKVPRSQNFSDGLTHGISRLELEKFLESMSLVSDWRQAYRSEVATSMGGLPHVAMLAEGGCLCHPQGSGPFNSQIHHDCMRQTSSPSSPLGCIRNPLAQVTS